MGKSIPKKSFEHSTKCGLNIWIECASGKCKKKKKRNHLETSIHLRYDLEKLFLRTSIEL